MGVESTPLGWHHGTFTHYADITHNTAQSANLPATKFNCFGAKLYAEKAHLIFGGIATVFPQLARHQYDNGTVAKFNLT